MKQEIKENQIFVYAPYLSYAPKKFRNAGGKWDKNTWIFALEDQEIVDRTCIDVYGVTGREQTAKAKIIARKHISALTESVVFKGFALSVARGRDSGAKTGEGVQLLSGAISSTGSVKNWYSSVTEGTEFIIKEFPVGQNSNEDFEIEYLEEIKPISELAKFSNDEILAEAKKRGLL